MLCTSSWEWSWVRTAQKVQTLLIDDATPAIRHYVALPRGGHAASRLATAVRDHSAGRAASTAPVRPALSGQIPGPGSRFVQRRHHRLLECSGGLPGLKIGVRF